MGGRGSGSGMGGFTGKPGNRMVMTMSNGTRSTFTYIGNGEIQGESGKRYRISEIPGGISGMKKRAAKVEFLGPEKKLRVIFPNMDRIDPQRGVPASVVSQEQRVQGYSLDNSATKEIKIWVDVVLAAAG